MSHVTSLYGSDVHPKQSATLSHLPPELLIRVLSYIPLKNRLSTCASVSQKWNNLVFECPTNLTLHVKSSTRYHQTLQPFLDQFSCICQLKILPSLSERESNSWSSKERYVETTLGFQGHPSVMHLVAHSSGILKGAANCPRLLQLDLLEPSYMPISHLISFDSTEVDLLYEQLALHQLSHLTLDSRSTLSIMTPIASSAEQCRTLRSIKLLNLCDDDIVLRILPWFSNYSISRTLEYLSVTFVEEFRMEASIFERFMEKSSLLRLEMKNVILEQDCVYGFPSSLESVSFDHCEIHIPVTENGLYLVQDEEDENIFLIPPVLALDHLRVLGLPRLKTVTLQDTRFKAYFQDRATNHLISEIQRSSELHSIRLQDIKLDMKCLISMASRYSSISNLEWTDIVETSCIKFLQNDWNSFVDCFPNLTHLKLQLNNACTGMRRSTSSNETEKAFLGSNFKTLPRLTHLTLDGCADPILAMMIAHCHQSTLKELKLLNLSHPAASAWTTISSMKLPFSVDCIVDLRFPQLQSLVLSSVHSAAVPGLRAIMHHFAKRGLPSLLELQLLTPSPYETRLCECTVYNDITIERNLRSEYENMLLPLEWITVTLAKRTPRLKRFIAPYFQVLKESWKQLASNLTRWPSLDEIDVAVPTLPSLDTEFDMALRYALAKRRGTLWNVTLNVYPPVSTLTQCRKYCPFRPRDTYTSSSVPSPELLFSELMVHMDLRPAHTVDELETTLLDMTAESDTDSVLSIPSMLSDLELNSDTTLSESTPSSSHSTFTLFWNQDKINARACTQSLSSFAYWMDKVEVKAIIDE